MKCVPDAVIIVCAAARYNKPWTLTDNGTTGTDRIDGDNNDDFGRTHSSVGPAVHAGQ